MPEIQSMSHKHVAILEFMLANPVMRLQDVAMHFGVSQPWLSCIIHSEAFQRMLKERQDETFNHTVLPLREKMTVVAHKMLDKLMDADTSAMDVETAVDVGKEMLDRLGFSPKAAPPALPPHMQQMVQIERERLARARSLIGVQISPTGQVSVALEVEGNATLPAIEGGENRVGGVPRERALPAYEGADASAEEGDQI